MMLLITEVEDSFVFKFKDIWTPKTGSKTLTFFTSFNTA